MSRFLNHFFKIIAASRLQHRGIANFRVVEHTARCAHTRERPAGAELDRELELRLSVKQYIPLNNEKPAAGDVTIIGATGNGFPKELQEPLWDDLSDSLASKGRKIRAIWIADMAHQGESGVINEGIIGADPSWYDHARDLLHLINQYQDDIPHPIIGVGHSMGASHLALLALLHPRLLHALVLIDPVIQLANPSKTFAPAGTYRRDQWPSRVSAGERFSSSPFYQKWDPRVLDLWIRYGLRDEPTELYPQGLPENPSAGDNKISKLLKRRTPAERDATWPVTLTTPKAQEVYSYVRPAYQEPRLLQHSKPDPVRRELSPADVVAHEHDDAWPFYRPEPLQLFHRLPELRPHVLYVVGSKSELSPPALRAERLQQTGIAPGASGGVAVDAVQEAVIDCGHLVPLERPAESAAACADFLDSELFRWNAEQQDRRLQAGRLSRRQRVEINDRWKEHVGPPPRRSAKNDTSTGKAN